MTEYYYTKVHRSCFTWFDLRGETVQFCVAVEGKDECFPVFSGCENSVFPVMLEGNN